MTEVSGDLWNYPAAARCITTNGCLKRGGRLVMGAGVAEQALNRYPDIDCRLGDLVKLFGNTPFFLADCAIISFPTKRHWRYKSSLSLIVESARHVSRLADNHQLTTVALPRPGCGHGGLVWEVVRPLLLNILDDRFVVVDHQD